MLLLLEAAADELEVLDISGNHNFTSNHLTRLPTDCYIKTMYVWDNEQLSLHDVLSNDRIGYVFHRSLFQLAYLEAFSSSLGYISRPSEKERTTKKNTMDAISSVPRLASQIIFARLADEEQPAQEERLRGRPLFGPETELYKKLVNADYWEKKSQKAAG